MARARNIKPSFFTNEQLADSCPLGRLLFIGMWTMADYKGDFEWKERTLKIQLLPWDECSVKALAITLDKSGLIRFYSDGIKIYIHIPNFEKHQNPHKNEREKGSDIPCYSDAMRQAIDLESLTINRDLSGAEPKRSQSDPAESLLLNPESLNLNPESVSPKSQQVAPAPQAADCAGEPSGAVEVQAVDIAARIFDHWKHVMNHPKAKLDDKRRKKILGALKLKYTPDDLIQAINGCAKTPYNMGCDGRNTTVYDDIELILRDASHIDRFLRNNTFPVLPAISAGGAGAKGKFSPADFHARNNPQVIAHRQAEQGVIEHE